MTLNTNLLGLYHFTGDATDSSGNSNDMTTNLADLTTDKNSESNQAYDFTASNSDYMELATTFGMDYSTPSSYSAWFQYSNTNSVTIVNHTLGGSNDIQTFIWVNASGYIRFERTLHGVGNNDVTRSVTLTNGQWYHVVGTYTGSQMELFVDGVSIGTTSVSGGGSHGSPIDVFDIGCYNATGSRALYYDGKIDEVRVYDKALSDHEVLQLYVGYDTDADSVETKTTDLETYWKLDGDLTDSVNSNDMTNSGTTDSSSGKINNCRDWDGSNDYATAPAATISGFNSDSNCTMNLWIQFDNVTSRQDVLLPTGGSYGTYYAWRLQMASHGSGVLTCASQKSSVADVYFLTSGALFSTATWYMITVVQDGSGYRLYKDGVYVTQDTTKGTTGDTTGFNGTVEWCRSNNYRFNGRMDEISIWSRALTQTEITELYNSGSGLQYPFTTEEGATPKALKFGGGVL